MRTRIISLLLTTIISYQAFSQKDLVYKKLGELHISTEFLEKSDDKNLYSFHGVSTAHSASFDTVNKTVNVSVFDFNPKATPKYSLKTINGHPPSDKELKTFNKKYNSGVAAVGAKADLNSLNIISEDNQKIVIGFKIDPKSLTETNKYLKNCIGEFHIDKQSKRMNFSAYHSTQPFSLSILKVTKMEVSLHMQYMPETNTYVTVKDETLMDVAMPISFGNLKMTAKGSESTVFSDFKLVN